MTGTIDLSADQFQTIARGILSDFGGLDRGLCRVILHPARDGAVKVVIRESAWGDVLESHYYVLRNGRRLTGHEYDQLPAETTTTTAA